MNRRQFMKATGTIGVGAATFPTVQAFADSGADACDTEVLAVVRRADLTDTDMASLQRRTGGSHRPWTWGGNTFVLYGNGPLSFEIAPVHMPHYKNVPGTHMSAVKPTISYAPGKRVLDVTELDVGGEEYLGLHYRVFGGPATVVSVKLHGEDVPHYRVMYQRLDPEAGREDVG